MSQGPLFSLKGPKGDKGEKGDPGQVLSNVNTHYGPNPPVEAKEGDLWFESDNLNHPRIYHLSNWVTIQDGMIAAAQLAAAAADAKAVQAQIIAQTGIVRANDLKSSLDGKASTYFMNDPPWSNGATGHEADAGDLWFDTNDGNKLRRWSEPSKTWVLSEDQRVVDTQNLVNTKITTYYSTNAPLATTVGDLWVDTDDHKMFRWDGTNWINIQDSDIASANLAAQEALNNIKNTIHTASKVRVNLCSNPSFETGIHGWEASDQGAFKRVYDNGWVGQVNNLTTDVTHVTTIGNFDDDQFDDWDLNLIDWNYRVGPTRPQDLAPVSGSGYMLASVQGAEEGSVLIGSTTGRSLDVPIKITANVSGSDNSRVTMTVIPDIGDPITVEQITSRSQWSQMMVELSDHGGHYTIEFHSLSPWASQFVCLDAIDVELEPLTDGEYPPVSLEWLLDGVGPEDFYGFGFDLREISGDGGDFIITAIDVDENGQELRTTTLDTISPQSQSTRVVVGHVAPEQVTDGPKVSTIRFVLTHTSPGAVWQLDNVLIEQLSDAGSLADYVSPYFDGSTPSEQFTHYSWSGETAASISLQRIQPEGFNTGDIWFDTGDGNRLYFFNGSSWIDVRDTGISVAESVSDAISAITDNNTDLLTEISEKVENNTLLAFSAHDAVTSVDGRISISDYDPALGDADGKNDGSLWFTRTRTRLNLCSNPSFEVSTKDWEAIDSELTRNSVNTADVVTGTWVGRVTNDESVSLETPGTVRWTPPEEEELGDVEEMPPPPEGQYLESRVINENPDFVESADGWALTGSALWVEDGINFYGLSSVKPAPPLERTHDEGYYTIFAKIRIDEVPASESVLITFKPDSTFIDDVYFPISEPGWYEIALPPQSWSDISTSESPYFDISIGLDSEDGVAFLDSLEVFELPSEAEMGDTTQIGPKTFLWTGDSWIDPDYYIWTGYGWEEAPESIESVTALQTLSGFAPFFEEIEDEESELEEGDGEFEPGDGESEDEDSGDGEEEPGESEDGEEPGPSAPEEEFKGNVFDTSGYLRLTSGIGVGVYAFLEFSNVDGDIVGRVEGDLVDLNPNDWIRVSVTGELPDDAVSLASAGFCNPNANDVWSLDGILIEQAPLVGRYFDGRSFDAEWTGEEDVSTSTMTGGKFQSIYELDSGDWVPKVFYGDTLVDIDASTVTRGSMSGKFIADNSIAPDKLLMPPVTASEDLSPGDLVNVYTARGGDETESKIGLVRKASASETDRGANGYVLAYTSGGDPAIVYTSGYNPYSDGLISGTVYLSTTPGVATSEIPTGSNGEMIFQRVGWASDPTIYDVTIDRPILIEGFAMAGEEEEA